MTLEAIKYNDGSLQILDQLLLPFKSEYIDVKDTNDGWNVIKKMQVRGAPAIAIVGCLSLVVELKETHCNSTKELAAFIQRKLEYLVTARPTAVNMSNAAKYFSEKVQNLASDDDDMSVKNLKKIVITEMEEMLEKDLADNRAVGDFGADDILARSKRQPVCILTHCNTGALASAGYGTALGVIRSLKGKDALEHVYCTETRPYNQGARLTAYELVYEKMPATLICDSMAAMLMQRKKISAVVVGADRVVANGDTANKIGTYQLAIVAKHHDVPFYVACPTTAYDSTIANGDAIKIEERPSQEMSSINGIPIAAPGIQCWNPAFDVTPADLITGGIITEHGLFKPHELKDKLGFINGSEKV